MDGNGRWAAQKNKNRTTGHKEGVNTLRNTIKASILCNIKFLSVYAFSSENWKRPKIEVNFLLKLLGTMIQTEKNNLLKQDIKVKILGDKTKLSPSLNTKIKSLESETAHCKTLQLNIMINYGSREEIIKGFQDLLTDNPQIKPKKITAELFERYLYTESIPDPDLLIRTSGESRISNYLLWQISYSELYFHNKLWPDFTQDDFISILEDFTKRNRRFGAL